MILLILLISLAAERYLNAGAHIRRFNLFPLYLEQLQKFVKASFWKNSYQAIAIIVVPIFIFVALLYHIADFSFFGLIKFLIGAVILLYCLGPEDLYHQVYAYTLATNKNEPEVAHQVASDILGPHMPVDQTQVDKVLVTTIFEQANERLFTVIFWFAILGPAGAVLYRMIVWLRQAAEQADSPYANLATSAQFIQQILEWAPARLTALCYAVVGSFFHTIGFWLDNLFMGVSANQKILSECGRITLQLEPNAEVKPENVKEALVIIDYTLIVYVALVALFTVASWL